MDLKGLINIAGKPGLFKVVSQNQKIIIVESLIDKKRIPIHSHNQANLLEEIGIYTYEDVLSLSEVFKKIAKKEKCQKSISHKSSSNELISYFRNILSNYDEEKVYISDIKKVINWYNILQSVGMIFLEKKVKKIKSKKVKK
tara:strand:+ start:747 stop:1172 length:426 start_codon:yes stop_codon:yes gene_type:complete